MPPSSMALFMRLPVKEDTYMPASSQEKDNESRYQQLSAQYFYSRRCRVRYFQTGRRAAGKYFGKQRFIFGAAIRMEPHRSNRSDPYQSQKPDIDRWSHIHITLWWEVRSGSAPYVKSRIWIRSSATLRKVFKVSIICQLVTILKKRSK